MNEATGLFDGACCGYTDNGEHVQRRRYESHVLQDPQLPYIFHFGNRFFTPHWHENIEILYFRGKCTFICEREEYDICAGDIAVINSNALHALTQNRECEHDCLIVDMRFLAENGVDLSNLSFKRIIRDDTVRRLFINVAEEVKVLNEGGRFGETAVKAAILALVVCLCRHYSGFQNHAGVRRDAVKRAIGYIKNHFDEPLAVETIADTVNISKFHFCREFHSETGYTVVRYINNIRCFEAQKLLKEGKLSVSEIAYRCGFGNLSYFSRTYKAIMGCTPKSARNDSDEA